MKYIVMKLNFRYNDEYYFEEGLEKPVKIFDDISAAQVDAVRRTAADLVEKSKSSGEVGYSFHKGFSFGEYEEESVNIKANHETELKELMEYQGISIEDDLEETLSDYESFFKNLTQEQAEVLVRATGFRFYSVEQVEE